MKNIFFGSRLVYAYFVNEYFKNSIKSSAISVELVHMTLIVKVYLSCSSVIIG